MNRSCAAESWSTPEISLSPIWTGLWWCQRTKVEPVLEKATEIEVREAEQAKYIRETKSLRERIAKYQRI